MGEARRHMHRIGQPNDVRFLTFSCYRRLPLFRNDSIKSAFADRLALARETTGVRLIAWVVMPEHVHLLLMPRRHTKTITAYLRFLKRPFAQAVVSRWLELNARVLDRLIDARGATRFWQQGGGYDRVMRSEDDVREKIAYINSNPVRRGLVTRPEDWKWSSAKWYAGLREDVMPMDRIRSDQR